MNNQEILQKIVAYIEAIMVDKSMTSRDLAEICAKRSGKMSPRTIDKMFKTPSSTTLSTLLKVCDGLDLNLNAVFHSIEIAKTSAENGQQRLVYEIDNPAYNGYTGNYHVFYLPTSAYPEDHADQTLVHGVLKLGDFNSMHECSAILDPAYLFPVLSYVLPLANQKNLSIPWDKMVFDFSFLFLPLNAHYL